MTRKQDFVTREMVNNWNKALKTDQVTEETIRNAYKMFHIKEFTAQERDKILKLLTRKTLFNNQQKKVFPNLRPDWAKEDYCWECKQGSEEDVDEDLYHALWSCKYKEEVRSMVLSNLGIAPAQHTVSTLLWGQFTATFRCGKVKNANLSGNFFNWMTTLAFLNARQKLSRVNSAAITSYVIRRNICLADLYPRCFVVQEVSLLSASLLTRPPEDGS